MSLLLCGYRTITVLVVNPAGDFGSLAVESVQAVN